MAMNAESERDYGVTLRAWLGPAPAYPPYADQLYFWNQYLYHGGNLAARPSTSNHGLGLAVDLATEQMRRIDDKIGHKLWLGEGGPTRRAVVAPALPLRRLGNRLGDPIIKKGSTKRDAIRTLQKLLLRRLQVRQREWQVRSSKPDDRRQALPAQTQSCPWTAS